MNTKNENAAVPASTVAPDWRAEIEDICEDLLVCYSGPRITRIVSRLHAIAASPPSASESTASPSPVGEGRYGPHNWIPADKSSPSAVHGGYEYPEHCAYCGITKTEGTQEYCPCNYVICELAAQAPKPASGGGELIGFVDPLAIKELAKLRNRDRDGCINLWSRRNGKFVPVYIAAEADTANDRLNTLVLDEIDFWRSLVEELCPENIRDSCDECGGDETSCHNQCVYRRGLEALAIHAPAQEPQR